MMFTLNEKELDKLEAWKKKVIAEGVELQKKERDKIDPAFLDCYECCWEMGYPYTGAVGGQFEFTFTPTSIGTVCMVFDHVTKQKLDLTDYGSW